MARSGHPSPITRFVRGLPGTYLTLAEVARALGISEPTLRSRRTRHPEVEAYRPAEIRYMGKRPVLLYTLDGLEVMRKEFADRQFGPGRMRLWSADERVDRQRRQRMLHYYEQSEKPEMRAKGVEVRKSLDDQLHKRRRQLGLPIT